MKLGESIQTYNPTLAVRREYGTFQVKTPGGEELFITCKPGEPLAIEWPDSGNGNKYPFVVTKISEPVPLNLAEHVAPIRQAG
jgi:hypothetical protein